MPIIFTVFANPRHDLANLSQEQNGIQDALDPLVASKKVEHLIRTDANRAAFFDLLRNRPENEFAILHYGGHADSHALELQEGEAFFEEMAREIASRNPQSLQLVFLNGCSTRGHVEYLLGLGIPAVIATSAPVSDTRAKVLAVRFYQHIALGEGILQAYQSAVRFVNSGELPQDRKIEEAPRSLRGILLENEEEQQFPWGLYVREGVLLQGSPLTNKKTFNETMVRRLMEAVKEDCEPARRFLERASAIRDWEVQERTSDKAKEILAYSFVGVTGIQLSKLMAIGKEEASEGKFRKYIEKCHFTAACCLDVVNFALLSRLWEEQRQHPSPLPESIARRFDAPFEPTLPEQFELLTALYPVFKATGYALPIPELAAVEGELATGSNLYKVLEELQALYNKVSKAAFDQADGYQAEKRLTDFLLYFRFLVKYKMASIKHIGYRQIRKSPPRYLHRYAALGIDSRANVDAEKINYTDTPTDTDSVILYQGDDYRSGVNLSPFVLDYHALLLEQGTRICFFSMTDMNDGSLLYRVLEDNSPLRLERANPPIPADANFGELLLSDDNRKKINLDNAVADFMEARTALSAGFPNFDDL